MDRDPTQPSFYNEDYWAGTGHRDHGGYKDVHAGWDGWGKILKACQQVLSLPGQASVLDAGCGVGSSIKSGLALGLDCEGVDFSQWAVDHPIPGLPADRIRHHDLKEELRGLYDLTICASVLEHIPRSDLPTVLWNLARHTQWLFIKVDLLETDWPESKDVDPATYQFFYEGQEVGSDLEKALLESGHISVAPPSHWELLLHSHLHEMDRCYDKEDALKIRLVDEIDWDPSSYFVFCRKGYNVPRMICWAVDPECGCPESWLLERKHRGDVIGSCSKADIRSQAKSWQESYPNILPDFTVHRDHVPSIQLRWPWTSDFVFVEKIEDPLPAGIRRIEPHLVEKIRPSWRY